MKGVRTNEREKNKHRLKRLYFTAIGLTGVKIVAERHRHAVNHNKH